eukprot:6333968-Pyramimonas_sp.AAC.1
MVPRQGLGEQPGTSLLHRVMVGWSPQGVTPQRLGGAANLAPHKVWEKRGSPQHVNPPRLGGAPKCTSRLQGCNLVDDAGIDYHIFHRPAGNSRASSAVAAARTKSGQHLHELDVAEDVHAVMHRPADLVVVVEVEQGLAEQV